MISRFHDSLMRFMTDMKIPQRLIIGGTAALMLQPACAATIYSGLINTAIPTTFEGVTISIDGGTANFFFGGVGVANNSALQPFRDGTVNTDTLLNISQGTVLGSSTTSLSSGSGGSEDHVGTPFTAGAEGYIGFKLNGVDYGWLRVRFTNNTGGAEILEWAYDDNTADIGVGGIRQTGQNILLTMAFTLATQLADVGGATNVIKSGSGTTTTLTGNNTHTGATTVSEGTLALASGASLSNTSSVTVQNGGILEGLGSIAGPTTIQGGAIHSPGLNFGVQTFTSNLTYELNSSALWELGVNAIGTRGTDFDGVNVSGTLAFTGTTLMTLSFNNASSAVDWTNAFWDTSRTGTNGWLIYSGASSLTGFGNFDILTQNWADDNGVLFNSELAGNSFDLYQDGNNIYLNFTAIPEPAATLLGCLGLLLVLRRRRS